MKTLNTIILILALALTLSVHYALTLHPKAQQPKIDLPEEYKAITKADNLKGYWHNGTLYIYFANDNNKIKPDYTIELVGHDKVLVQSGNLVYSCHFDEIQEVIDTDTAGEEWTQTY